jgi:hypothetical protein
MVDFGDMPKTLLPYALSLNPGLPMHIQQNLVEREKEQRRSARQEERSLLNRLLCIDVNDTTRII